MKQVEIKYIDRYFIKGDFDSDFITKNLDKRNKSKSELDDSIKSIELVGRHKIQNVELLKSLPKDLIDKSGTYFFNELLKDIEVYPLKSQTSPLNIEKRWNTQISDELVIKNLIVEPSSVDESFSDEGIRKGKLIGTVYASICERVEVPMITPVEKLPEFNCEIAGLKIKKHSNKESFFVAEVKNGEIQSVKQLDDKVYEVKIKAPINGFSNSGKIISCKSAINSSKNGGCLKNGCNSSRDFLLGPIGNPPYSTIPPAGCTPLGGCSSLGGCRNGGCSSMGGCSALPPGCNLPMSNVPSCLMGCQRMGCGLLSLLLGLLLLLFLLGMLRECNNSSSNGDDRQYDEVRVDTVKIFEVDTIEKLVLDTLYSIDTVKLTDTMYTVVKNALPLPNVLFKSNSAIIRTSSMPGIKSLGDSLIAHPEIKLIIAGHTDASGNDNHNDSLSYCRAKAVRDVLTDTCSVEFNRLKIEGYGEKCPVEENKSIEGKTTNRRVEFRYFGQGVGKCEEFKIEIDEDVCNSGAYLSSVEIPEFKSDTIIEHKIKHLETLYSISKKYSVSIKDLVNLNPGVQNGIVTGQTIKIPIHVNLKKNESDSLSSKSNIYTINKNYDFVNVKAGRKRVSRILYRVRKGQEFNVIDSSDSNWWRISFKGTEGFIQHYKVIKVDLIDE